VFAQRLRELGPIAEGDLVDAYRTIGGHSPTDAVIAQLQRLPGLTERGQTQGTRSFVDEDMLYALQGSGLARFVLHGVDLDNKAVRWLEGLHQKAVAMAAYQLRRLKQVNGRSWTGGASRKTGRQCAISVRLHRYCN